MPRDWMHEGRGRDDRPGRWEDERRRPSRDDFGQADFSSDYAYDPGRRTGFRAADEMSRDDDYGQADYSTDFAYDSHRGAGYRRFSGEERSYRESDPDLIYGRRMDQSDYRRGEPPRDARSDRERFDERDYRQGRDEPEDRRGEGRGRSWAGRAGAFFTGREEGETQRRRGPSDRVLWAVIVERLEDERGLDLRDVEVLVDNAEVTLNGTVRRKDDRRRIEDIADIQGVRHVQNNLRVRDSGRRWF